MGEMTGSHGNRLTLELDGPRITAEKFIRAVKDLFATAQEVSKGVLGDRGRVLWIVSVESGSARIHFTPEPFGGSPEATGKIIAAMSNGIEALEKKSERPPFFSDTALRKMRDLVSVIDATDGDIQRVSVIAGNKLLRLSHKAVAHVDDLIGTVTTSLGTVEGRLEVLSGRHGYKIVVYDDLTDRPVSCYFEERILPEVHAAFKRRVAVFGEIRYRRDGQPTSIRIREFRVFRKKEELPTSEDVRGILGR